MPTLRDSSSASSLRFATIASASACRSRARSFGGVLPHGPSSAARAASTARSTSASPAIAARASGSPVAGSCRSRISPEAGSTTSPPMKSPYSCPAVTAIEPELSAFVTPPDAVDFGSETPDIERRRDVEHVRVQAARIPDRDRLLEALRDEGLDAEPEDEIGIVVPRRRRQTASSSTRSRASSSASARRSCRSSTRA